MSDEMAPLKNPVKKDENDRRVNEILDAARKANTLLQDRSAFPTSFQADLESGIKRVTILSTGPSVAAKALAFDSIGTDLWNHTTNLLRDIEDDQQGQLQRRDAPRKITTLLRVFAFQLLNTAFRASSKRTRDSEQRARNLKLALKTCRSCLDTDELELTQKTFETCSGHVTDIEAASPLVRLTEDSDEEANLARMKALASEFQLLRVMHAWKSGRLDVAEHFTAKLSLQDAHAVDLPEKAADLYYEIGRSLIKKGDRSMAVAWLERALSALRVGQVEHLSDNTDDLRLSISAKLVRCLSLSAEVDSDARARQIVQELSDDFTLGNRLAVQIMQLDMLLGEASISRERVHALLHKIVRTVLLTDQTFKIVVQAVHRVRRHSFQTACDALMVLIRDRLLSVFAAGSDVNEKDHARLEKACVTYIMFSASAPNECVISALQSIDTLFETFVKASESLLSAKAVHAMQTLMWKAAETNTAMTDAWVHLMRHPALEAAGQANKAKIGRKAIGLALERNDIDAAREAYYKMPEGAQNENLTQFLMFKIGLRCNDHNLAESSLDSIARHTRDDGKYLYACVLEAQESRLRQVAVLAFEALLDRQPAGAHLPTLLRCTARLLADELEAATPERTSQVVEGVLRVFENAAKNVRSLKQGSGDQWRAEIQWWSKNIYNLALKLCGNVHPEQLCRLLKTCITFTEHYPKDSGAMHDEDPKRRKMLCQFLCASAYVVLARSGGEGEEHTLQCYIKCREQVQGFVSTFDTASSDKDISRRMFEMLKYEVESILRLQQWDQLHPVLQACLDCKHVDRWDTLADLVLIIHSQSRTIGIEGRDNEQMITLIQRIINETWKKDRDLVKVSRWLRLSFSVDLSDGDGTFAFKLLQQAADMAKKGYEGSSDQKYPETELQWLGVTAFNRAVDFMSAGKHEMARTWIDGALELARYAADNGAQHSIFTYKKRLAVARMEEREREAAGGM